jgi:hypothetical protein
VGDEMTLTIIQIIPIGQVLAKIYFFSSPEAGFRLLIEFPDIVVLNREENEPVFVLLQNRF